LESLRRLFEMAEGVPHHIEPRPYTLDEALKMLEAGNAMVVQALEEGIVLAGERASTCSGEGMRSSGPLESSGGGSRPYRYSGPRAIVR
jgi:hypothetical protein